MGFSTHIWQILLSRGLTALFSFGGFLASIALGEVVKGETGSQGMCSMVKSRADASILVFCFCNFPGGDAGFRDRWISR